MANIVLGIGTSHSPQLSAAVEWWPWKGEHDRGDPRVGDFEALSREKASWMSKEITPEKMLERHTAIQDSIAELHETFVSVSPDVVVTIGDDQREVFSASHMPALNVYWGDSVENIPPGPNDRHRTNPWFNSALWANYGETQVTYPCESDLGMHMIESFIEDEIDVAHTKALPEGKNIGHSYNFVYRRIMIDHVVPQVPIMLNTYYPPNQPTARRCFAIGKAIRRAIESWNCDKRVVIVASGGLSHFVVDTKMDLDILEAMEKKDEKEILNYPESMYVQGTSETKSWVTLAGAMQDLDCSMEVVNYVPGYRSLAGTGCGAAFALWKFS